MQWAVRILLASSFISLGNLQLSIFRDSDKAELSEHQKKQLNELNEAFEDSPSMYVSKLINKFMWYSYNYYVISFSSHDPLHDMLFLKI